MRRCWFAWLLGLIALAPGGTPAFAFGGFYVAKSESRLFNQAAKVVFARYDGKSVITMVNDYQGALEEFAVIVPVPSVLERGQIHVASGTLVDRLDAYTAPRLIRSFDDDPCGAVDAGQGHPARAAVADRDQALGVTVEATYTVGEYDVQILSAEQSDGLTAWLRSAGYRLPDGAEDILAAYVAGGMRFFLARVNLKEQSKLGYSYLRPLQIAFESDDFALPLRLGMLNGAGPQEMWVYLLTREGRVETANYRTASIPSDVEVPLFVEDEFSAFYGAMFDAEVAGADRRAVFLEYAGDLARCDPCAADPLSEDELRELGVFWLLDAAQSGRLQEPRAAAMPDVFVTRLHLRYDAEHFPDDLRFRETTERSGFQARYTLRRPWQGKSRCAAALDYLNALPDRFETEAQTLARLTRWSIADIRTKMEANHQSFAPPQLTSVERKWWERLWPEG